MKERSRVVIYAAESRNTEIHYKGEYRNRGDVVEEEMEEFGLSPLQYAERITHNRRRYHHVHNANKMRLESHKSQRARHPKSSAIDDNKVNFETLMPALSKQEREEQLNNKMEYQGELRLYRDVVLQEMAERDYTLVDFERLRHVDGKSYLTLEEAEKIRLIRYKKHKATESPYTWLDKS